VFSLTWTKLPSNGLAPNINSSASMAYWSDALYFFGGYLKEDFPIIEPYPSLYKYDLSAQIWTVVKQTSVTKSYADHGMVTYQDTLYRFQGYNSYEGDMTEIYKINLKATDLNWERIEFIADDEPPHDSYAFDVVDNQVWFVTGWTVARLRNDVMTVDLGKV
jgi:N-acetylneuraminic acid mutarotase